MTFPTMGNQKGSVLLIVTSIVTILSVAGIFLIRSLASDLSIVGQERNRTQLQDVAKAAFSDLMACEISLTRVLQVLPQVGDDRAEFQNKASPCEAQSPFTKTYGDYLYRYNADLIRTTLASGESASDTRAYHYKVKIMIYSKPDVSRALGTLEVRFNKLGLKKEGYVGEEQIIE